MTNKTQTTSIIALSALIVTFAMPSAFANAGTEETYYWQSDPEMCYLENELADIDFEDSTGSSNVAAIESELNDAVATYNAEMNGITIDPEDSTCNGNKIEVGAYSLAEWTWLAQEGSSWSGTSMTASYIDFNTDHGFGDESNWCFPYDYDIEWTMNHELGHGIGLKHHDHWIADSVMHPSCRSTWSALQSVDDTAIDIHYS